MSENKVVLMEFEQNPNVGLYMFVNDKFCILGKEVDSKKLDEIESVLGVKVYMATCLGTDLIGVFIAGNNDILVVPDMYDYEMKIFEKIAKENNVKLIVLNDKQNTYGNNLCVGSDKILINPTYNEKFAKDIEKETNYEVFKVKNKEFETAGSICRFMKGKYFFSQEILEDEVKSVISETCGVGTVNSGSNFVSSGIVGNKNGLILGSLSTTIEIQNIVEGFDYI